MCQKRHTPLCPLPEGFRQKREEEKRKKPAAKAGNLRARIPEMESRDSAFLRPWPHVGGKRGLDVFAEADRWTLLDKATFSRAREIPIAGAPNAPKPVRSGEYPLGIPEEVRRMSGNQRSRLDCDSKMAEMAAQDCWRAAEEGKPFSLEHPAGSIAFSLKSWKRLLEREDVEKIEYTTCMFEGYTDGDVRGRPSLRT